MPIKYSSTLCVCVCVCVRAYVRVCVCFMSYYLGDNGNFVKAATAMTGK